MRAVTRDTIISQIPQHIVEQYPNFVEFLESYYTWLNQPGNPYERIKHHMDYVSFKKSIDDYTNAMFNEYLAGIPPEIQADKELMIRWSKEFHLARGSHESYKFLFRVLFNDDNVNIYLPKDNILRTSDGTWIDNQHVMIVTNPGDPDTLMYKRIYQKREVEPGVFVTASATVDGYNLSYSGRFNTVHLILVDVEGEFVHTHPVLTDEENPIEVWPIRTVVDFIIEDGGKNYFTNELIVFDNTNQKYVKEGEIVTPGAFDTNITTLLTVGETKLYIDEVEATNYTYDGRFVYSSEMELGSVVRFEIDQIKYGTMKIGGVSSSGSVRRLIVEDAPVGVVEDIIPLVYETGDHTTSVGLGTGLVAYAVIGVVRKLAGFYVDNKGWLSSSMYLQDGHYYQEFSYEIQSVHEVLKYATIVKNVLHPSGFKMFGKVRIYSLIEMMVGILDEFSGVYLSRPIFYDYARYTAGTNYLWAAKNGYMSPRVYSAGDFDPAYMFGDLGYNLEDKSFERTYDERGNKIVVDRKGWMTKLGLSDFDIRQPQDYVEFDEYNWEAPYYESSYVIRAGFDESVFINKYISTYSAINYNDTGYSD